MIKYKLSEYAVTVWKIYSICVFILSAFICGGISVFNFPAGILFFIIFISIFIFAFFYYIPLYFKQYCFSISEEKLVICKGVFSQNEIHLLRQRIQYIEFVQTFIDKKYGCGTVVLHISCAVIRICHIDVRHADLFDLTVCL